MSLILKSVLVCLITNCGWIHCINEDPFQAKHSLELFNCQECHSFDVYLTMNDILALLYS